MKRLEGKIAVVTGGALGIGLAAGTLMAKEGAKIALTDIRDAEGEKAAREICADGGDAVYWHLDVAREEEAARVFGEIRARFGNITVLVNNAGISGANKPTHELSEAEWDKVTSIDQKGVFFCTKHAVPQMLEAGGGSIINLSSIYGIVGAPDFPPYHASKGAVRLMTKTDAMFYAQNNIRVNSIHPGYIWTPMVEQVGRDSPEGLEKFRENLAARHPVGRVGEPDDIAYGIVYLASDESKFVTGSELVIDGGYTAR